MPIFGSGVDVESLASLPARLSHVGSVTRLMYSRSALYASVKDTPPSVTIHLRRSTGRVLGVQGHRVFTRTHSHGVSLSWGIFSHSMWGHSTSQSEKAVTRASRNPRCCDLMAGRTAR